MVARNSTAIKDRLEDHMNAAYDLRKLFTTIDRLECGKTEGRDRDYEVLCIADLGESMAAKLGENLDQLSIDLRSIVTGLSAFVPRLQVAASDGNHLSTELCNIAGDLLKQINELHQVREAGHGN